MTQNPTPTITISSVHSNDLISTGIDLISSLRLELVAMSALRFRCPTIMSIKKKRMQNDGTVL